MEKGKHLFVAMLAGIKNVSLKTDFRLNDTEMRETQLCCTRWREEMKGNTSVLVLRSPRREAQALKGGQLIS